MEDQRPHRGYSHAHASRLVSKPSSKHTPPKKPKTIRKQTTPGGRALINGNANNSTVGARKSLVDAFKQHGMKLCDGTKLNAVGKAIQCIGPVPPAVSASITALFLSQNNLRTLNGVEQFTSSLRLLSIGGNLLTLFSEIERLTELPRLRNLNLLGNPICDHPNYRLRVIDTLKQLQVLDTADVTVKERELAPLVASQDRALRCMVLHNHFEIQQLQLITRLITLRSDFYSFVLVHTASSSSRFVSFDCIPNPSEAHVDVAMLLRLWKYQERLSDSEMEALEIQMGTIVMRTHNKLAEHPKLRAKEFLLQLVGGKGAKKQAIDNNRSISADRGSSSWQEAYESVIALQQQTVANLQGLCERNNSELVANLKTLLTTDPSRRRQLVNARWYGSQSGGRETSAGERESSRRLSSNAVAASLGHKRQLLLPPQQQDPDQYEQREGQCERQERDRVHDQQAREQREGTADTPRQVNRSHQQSALQQRQLTNGSRIVEIRNGEFDNRTLSEAVHHFKLREPNSRPAAAPPPPPESFASSASACYSHLRQPQVFTIQHEIPVNLHEMAFKAKTTSSSFAESKTAFHPVTNGKLPGNFAFDDDDNDAQGCHDLAVVMNQKDSRTTGMSSAFREARVRQRASAVDESVETASSISNFSDASSYWRSSRVASAADRKGESSTQRGVNKVTDSPPRPPVSTTAHRDPGATESESLLETKARASYQEPTSGNGDRHQELEEREAKYIKALIESEQRELELRNQLTTFKCKLSQHQQVMAQELQEREQIKSEVNERVQNVAAPKVLRRFFIRWIHFYHWSLQLAHLRTRRCFIQQHDCFWRWRRKVWVQQRLRSIRFKAQTRAVQRHFAQWVNLSRLSIITKFTREKHEKRRFGELFWVWKQGIKTIRKLKLADDCRTQDTIQKLQRGCFSQWASLTRHRRHLKAVMALHSRHSNRVLQEITFCRWKLVVLAHARPLRAKVDQFVSSKQSQLLRDLFISWKNLVKGNKLYCEHLRRRVWRHWTHRFRCEKAERETAARSRRLVLKDRIQSWRAITQDRIASRRALSLAKRYVNQRRLRKLWLYWKCYTFAKRKYVQGSTKALKHYFVKLLRSSWLKWKRKTRKNLMSVREQKHSELQRHFQALRTGVKLSIAAKCRARLLNHLRTRCDRTLVRQWLVHWRAVIRRRRRAKQGHQVLAHQAKQASLRSSWGHWLGSYLVQVRAKLQSAMQQYEQVVSEKHEVEAEVLRVNSRMMTMNEQLQSFEGSIRDQEREISSYQGDLLHSKELRVALEKKIKALEDSHAQERQQWAAMDSQLSEQRASEQHQTRTVAESNSCLQRQIEELQAKLIEEQQRTLDANHKVEVSRQELSQTQQSHETGVAQLRDSYKSLEQCVEDLKLQLQDEQQQKEETASRLQEYEIRLATTCADINQHEEAHERENERLRNEREQMEARVSEELARNAELQRLAEEKNAIILQLTLQQNTRQSDHQSQHHFQPTIVPMDNGTCRESSGEPISPPSSRPQQMHSGSSSLSSGYESETRRKSTAPLSAPDTTIGSLLKDINQSILVRAGMMETKVQSEQQYHYERQSSGALAANRFEKEVDGRMDEQANKVHEDIRQLQARIANRLKHAPASRTAESSAVPVSHRRDESRKASWRFQSICFTAQAKRRHGGQHGESSS
ncbi:hypothetical protein Gpo141_00003089 [Globisporangium polare]